MLGFKKRRILSISKCEHARTCMYVCNIVRQDGVCVWGGGGIYIQFRVNNICQKKNAGMPVQ